MKFLSILVLCSVTLILQSCTAGSGKASSTSAAEVIYYGGEILTMEGDSASYVQAVAIKDGKIILAGSKEDADKLQGDSTTLVDLQGKTMLPGFIDPHSHLMFSLAMSAQANCSSPPVGPVQDVDGIIAALQSFKAKRNIPAGDLIVGYGYDENQMRNGRLLNKDDLDKVSTDNPVLVIHVSGHGGVLNTAGLKKFGYNSSTITPKGGVIVRKPGTNEPYGLIMEQAYLPIYSNLPEPKPDDLLQQLKDGQMMYASAGITTAQEGSTHKADLDLLKTAAKQHELFVDVVSYPFILDLRNVLQEYPFSTFGTYDNHLKIGGVKIVEDGSPQGKTAFFTTPYLTGGPSGEKNWRGEPTFPQDSLNAWFKWLYGEKIQILVHANGDATMDMILKAHQFASGADSSVDRRTTVVHSQFIRQDQLDKYKTYQIIPSFFASHIFFFGDTHIKNRGLKQASFLSPLHTALAMGLPATNHTDFNVTPLDQMMVLWCAVNRLTRTGIVLGANERITPYQALQAITSNAAHQYFEENAKGSIRAGKLADLVILNQNPLRVDPLKIKDIKVVQTIKEGKTIYQTN